MLLLKFKRSLHAPAIVLFTQNEWSPDHEVFRYPPPLHSRIQGREDELGDQEPEESPQPPHHSTPEHLGGGVVLEVDPAVGHQGARPEVQRHAQGLPGHCVGQAEQRKQH